MPSWAVPAIIIGSVIFITAIAGCCYIYYKRHIQSTVPPEQMGMVEVAALKPSSPSFSMQTTLDVSVSMKPVPTVALSKQALQSIFFSSIQEDRNSDTHQNQTEEIEQTTKTIPEPYLLNDYCIDPIRQTGGSHSSYDPDPYPPPDSEHTANTFTSSH